MNLADYRRPIPFSKFDMRGEFTPYDRALEKDVREALAILLTRKVHRWWRKSEPLPGNLKWSVRSFVARNPYHPLSSAIVDAMNRVFGERV